MKTNFLFMLVLLLSQGLKAQTTHTVEEVGFSYSPATLTINAGESVKFNGTATHPIVEVSQTTWNSNGITPLEGGFSIPTGNGTINFPVQGTYYYVCTAHVASLEMKGKVIVLAPAALEEVTSVEKFIVFPSPLIGNDLTIALKSTNQQQIILDIYDMAGNLLISSWGSTVDGKYRIDCSTLPKGLFLLKMEAEGEASLAKIVRL
jgi:plastocyanin